VILYKSDRCVHPAWLAGLTRKEIEAMTPEELAKRGRLRSA
jgi:hypothetical protein